MRRIPSAGLNGKLLTLTTFTLPYILYLMNILLYLKNNPELILGIIFFFCLLTYALIRFPIYRLAGRHFANTKASEDEHKAISVVVTTHNQGSVLEHNLEIIATQDYPNYEVIVVNDDSTDETSNIIKRVENKYPHVRHTFTPSSARYVSHSKLAITLGIRSAKNEWILLTEGDCHPVNSHWISQMASACDNDHDFVLGYSNFERKETLHSSRISLDRLIHQLRFFHAAGSRTNSKAVGGNNCNIALRKSVFLNHKGFSGNLNLLGGEDLLFVDATSQPGRTGVVISPSAAVLQQLPAITQQWHTFKLFQTEAARHLSHKGLLERFLWASSTITMYASILLVAAIIVLCFSRGELIVPAIAIFLLLIVFICDLMLFNRTAKFLEGRKFPILYTCYNLSQPFFNLEYRIQSHFQRQSLMRGV